MAGEVLRHRIADKRILRLVIKWLNAGVLEDGQLSDRAKGTPQGGSLSPLLVECIFALCPGPVG